MTAVGRRLRVLVLSWNYPTPAAPQRGLWVERMCDAASLEAEVSVIVPTPWVPPLIPVQSLARFRQVSRRERRAGVQVYFPRIPGSIEYHTHAIDARLAFPFVLSLARRLHRERLFDVIHAHFIYPDGVVASRLGRELGIPVMTSEHALWTPWLTDQTRIGSQVDGALPQIHLVTAVSDFLRKSIDEYVRKRVDTAILPNVVDDTVFSPSPRQRDPHELLYVGAIRKVKRVDVLLQALAKAREALPELRLRVLSADALRAYATDRREVRALISSLGLDSVVHIEHGVNPPAVAEAMRRCAFVVVSSTRRETFSCVIAEALACGTPVIITRCGGPEEFVSAADGVMVEPDNPDAFAEGILQAMQQRDKFCAEGSRNRIINRFGRVAWCEQAMATYERVAARRRTMP
jgi:teichuronic acid biosynthesis glycosyltransferase TuaC